jgi:large subunit ribosomal protein L21
MTYAIFTAAGRQLRAEKGAVIRVPRLDGKPGDSVTFDEVLLTNSGKKIRAGNPKVSGASVSAEIVRHGRGDKIVVFKFKRRKNYRRKQGHRQDFTEVKVTDVKVGS